VANYKQRHPDEFEDTAHQFVLMPRREDNGSQPIVASGKTGISADRGYTLDYALQNAPINSSVRVHFGGYIHEFLHGVGAGHDDAKLTTEAGKLSIMGYSPDFLKPGLTPIITHAQCARFDVCEVFQPTIGQPYYTPNHPTAVDQLVLHYNPADGMLQLNGKYTENM
jgi:hypothetical protein